MCTAISGFQLVQNKQINKELVVKFWFLLKNYGSVLYSFTDYNHKTYALPYLRKSSGQATGLNEFEVYI